MDRKEYLRQWRNANREAVREYMRRYNEENREKLQQQKREYYANNRDTWLERAKRQYEQDSEAVKARATRWNKENPDRRKEIYKASAKRNPDTQKAAWHRRRAKLRGVGGDYRSADILAMIQAQSGKCAGCAKNLNRGYEIDHIMPLSLGGTNDRRNLQLLCRTCNRRKGAMSPDEWAARIGKLFV